MRLRLLTFAFPLIIGTFSHPDVSEFSGYNYNNPSSGNIGLANQPSGSYLPTGNSEPLRQPSSRTNENYISPSSQPNSYNPSHNNNAEPARFVQPSGNYIPPTGFNNVNADRLTQPTKNYIPPNQQIRDFQPNGNNNYFQPQLSNGYIPPNNQYPSGGGYHPNGQHSGNLLQDEKQVYYFAAPDEEEQTRFRINIAPSSQKNSKIIFVKAPSYGNVVPEVIAPQSQAEDKTLVYVLVKKPQQNGGITIPAGAGIKQAKPEVYFIKYKNQHDAERAVSESLQGHSAGSHLPDLGNERNFINNISDSLQKSGKLEDLDSNGGLPFEASGGGHGDSPNSINGGSLGNGYGPPGASGPY